MHIDQTHDEFQYVQVYLYGQPLNYVVAADSQKNWVKIKLVDQDFKFIRDTNENVMIFTLKGDVTIYNKRWQKIMP